MSLILLVLGILATTAGVALVGFGIWINDFSQLNTFILAGTSGVVGGFLLIGLWAVVAELHRVAEALRARQPAAEPMQPAQTVQPTKQTRPAEAALPSPETVAREPQLVEQPRPAATSAVEASTPAVERMRAAIPRVDKAPEPEDVPLSPNGQAINGQHVQHVEPPMDHAPRAPAAVAVETAREPRLDFLFRQRQARPVPPQPEFDALWPKRAKPGAPPDQRVEVARAPAPPAAIDGSAAAADVYVRPHPAAGPSSPAPAEEQRSVAILKSGVVDGMAYTLYADGSIEAQLPQGTVRFGSIAELRAHIENSSHG